MNDGKKLVLFYTQKCSLKYECKFLLFISYGSGFFCNKIVIFWQQEKRKKIAFWRSVVLPKYSDFVAKKKQFSHIYLIVHYWALIDSYN